jgi:hypothetical protein
VKLSRDKIPESNKELEKMRLRRFQSPIVDIPEMIGYFSGRLEKIGDA